MALRLDLLPTLAKWVSISVLAAACSSGTTKRERLPATSAGGAESQTRAPADDQAAGDGEAETTMPAATGEIPQPSADEMQIFLLIGQSNMEGIPKPEAEDSVENERVQVLGYDNSCGRTYNEWQVASPPLHSCWAGVGPGDYFAKTVAEAWPDATIGLVPCAIAGVDIDFFRKGVVSERRDEFSIPPDDSREGAYEMVIERAQLAQQSGTIRGILFHQGESDTGDSAWVDKVEEMVADLRADLSLGEDVPFIAGEILYDGCCDSHNRLVNQLPDQIPGAYVVSAEGLGPEDEAHFDLMGQRELGRRYAEAFLSAIAE
jgi:hypothetical protein